ncbi:MAG: hypothetical protein ACPGO3_07910 [Magnetospiraceae bacterium]
MTCDAADLAAFQKDLAGYLRLRASPAPAQNLQAALVTLLQRMQGWQAALPAENLTTALAPLTAGAAPEDILISSFLFAQTGDPAWMARLMARLEGLEGGPEDAYRLWLAVEYLLFLAFPNMDRAASQALRLGPLAAFYARLAAALPPPPPVPDGADSVLILTRIFRPPQEYGPAWDALEYAHVARQDMGLSPVIVDCNLLAPTPPLPLWPPSLYHPAPITDPIPHRSGHIPVARLAWGAGFAGITAQLDKIVARHRPRFCLAIGDGNLCADYLAAALPTAVLHYTVDLPIAARAWPCIHEDRLSAAESAALKARDLAPIPIAPAFSPPLPSLTQAGPDLTQLAPEAFWVGVVGHRLHSDVTDDFLAMLENLMAANAALWVVFVGLFEGYQQRLAPYPQLVARSLFLGRAPDLAAVFDRLQVFLNPRRPGGGISAGIALGLGVPVLALREGDVASVAGIDACFGNWADLSRYLVALSRDAGLLARAQQAAQDRFAALDNRLGNLRGIAAALLDGGAN